MKYNVFEEAAAQASLGMRESDTQIQQVMARIVQLRARRDLLETVARQMLTLLPTRADAAPSGHYGESDMTAEERPPELVPPSHTAADAEGEGASAPVFPLPRPIRSEIWPANAPATSPVR